MLRIAICCGGGFSSSTMAEHLNRQLEEKHLTDEVFLEFIPFGMLKGGIASAYHAGVNNRQTEVDVALLCPHLEFPAQRAAEAGELSIPVFVLPMRLYGLGDVEDLIEDAEDVLELWRSGVKNVVTFPDEPRSMTAARVVSHRKWLGEKS